MITVSENESRWAQRTRFFTLLCLCLAWPIEAAVAQDVPLPTQKVTATEDFAVTGDGSSPNWKNAKWFALNARPNEPDSKPTKVKLLYSKTGLYVLMHGLDTKVTASLQEDFDNLWTQDVFEVFLWPEEKDPVYFEYEISPLGHELPILVPNLGKRFMGWRPWHYEGDRKIRKETSTKGGPKKDGSQIESWTAEIFIPYELLKPLRNVPPQPGTRWRANFYRMDYDDNPADSWDWARVGPSFHEFEKFGTLVFE